MIISGRMPSSLRDMTKAYLAPSKAMTLLRPCEKCDVYKEACLRQKMFTKGLNCLRKVEMVFRMPSSPITVSTPKVVDSVKALILVDKRVTREDISDNCA